MKKRFIYGLIAAAFCSSQAVAQTLKPVTNDDFSKETENPVTRQITLPLRYEADFLDGADQLTKSTFELDHAVVPFRLNDNWALITRTKLEADALPPKKSGDHWVDGLTNGYTTFFLSPEHGQGFYWGAGPVLYYPAMNEALGTTKWGSGPSVAFVYEDKGPWLVGSSPTTYGRSAEGPAAATEPTNFISIQKLAIISGMDGLLARRRRSRRTGSPTATNGPSRSAAT